MAGSEHAGGWGGGGAHCIRLVSLTDEAHKLGGQQSARGQLVGQQEGHALLQAVVHHDVAVQGARQAGLQPLPPPPPRQRSSTPPA